MEEMKKRKEIIAEGETQKEPQAENPKELEKKPQDPAKREDTGGISTPHYYLVNLAEIEEENILSTNTVLDNIMYCDKYRKKLELAGAIRTAYGRVRELGLQETEEFRNWARYILLSVCEMKEAVAEEILSWAGNGEDDMAFKYNIVRVFEEDRAEAIAEGMVKGKAEAILALLEDIGVVPEKLREKLMSQRDLDILKKWLKMAAHAHTVEEFEEQISCDGCLQP